MCMNVIEICAVHGHGITYIDNIYDRFFSISVKLEKNIITKFLLFVVRETFIHDNVYCLDSTKKRISSVLMCYLLLNQRKLNRNEI